jgi:hypothetical protein
MRTWELKSKTYLSFEVHVDCDFVGNWIKEDAMCNGRKAKERSYTIPFETPHGYCRASSLEFYFISSCSNDSVIGEVAL